MKRNMIFLLAIAWAMSSCQEQAIDPGNSEKGVTIKSVRDDKSFVSALFDMQKGQKSDLYALKSVTIDDDELKMYITVQYGGGCEKHEFNMIWPEVITMIYPPNFSVILNHDANGDLCEAYLTEILEIDMKDNALGFDDQSIKDMTVTVINGSNPDEKVQSN